MRIGIIGLPQSGKTTLFQLLTNNPSHLSQKASLKANTGIARVIDPRVTKLSQIFSPKKTTYAAIEMLDTANLPKSQNKNGSSLLEALKDVDAVVQVVRAFDNSSAARPMSELAEIQSELILADWGLVETRLGRIEKERAKGANNTSAKETALLRRFKETLEQEQPLRAVVLTEEEEKLIRGYNFLTRKPLLIAVNVDEEQMRRHSYPQKEELEDWAHERSIPVILISGQVEREISQLEEPDRSLFMADLGIAESGIERLSRVVYAHLGLISYFTVGEDEVRAWTIRQGTNARQAAGKIHSDLERGFIRAEVISYEDFITAGNMQKAKEKGMLRLEGREYIVQDGDIISIRFKV
ncbi:MAG: redox-regulated ATPase YchF [Limnochordia bacterium]|nr:redox-regulated ATPase YchF [Limnochordia bacterium]HPZ31719.1 redox-regulated ATPase YchF [Limnochordia bacterium]HQD71508.1 redox-regulated ATPase YchF [Limnochordia bacterium]